MNPIVARALAELRAKAFDRPPGAPKAPRVVLCTRCIQLEPETRRHAPDWTPEPVRTWVREGVVYFGAFCESCEWTELQASTRRRLDAVGDPGELGISAREREGRKGRHDAIRRELERYQVSRRAQREPQRLVVPTGTLDDDSLAGWLATKTVGMPQPLTVDELEARRAQALKDAARLASEIETGT